MGVASLLAALRFMMVSPLVRFDVTGIARAVLSWSELGVALATLILLALVARRCIRDRLGYALLVLFPLLFVMLVCGISVFRPILIPRITVWMVVPVMLVAAFAFTSPKLRLLTRRAAIALMAGCLVLGLTDTTFAVVRHTPDWPAFIDDARATLPPDALLVVGPHTGPLGMVHYGDAAMVERVRLWRPPPDHHETNAEWLERTVADAQPMTTAQLDAAVRSGQPVWLILDEDDVPLIPDLRAQLPEFAAATRRAFPVLTVFKWPSSGGTR